MINDQADTFGVNEPLENERALVLDDDAAVAHDQCDLRRTDRVAMASGDPGA